MLASAPLVHVKRVGSISGRMSDAVPHLDEQAECVPAGANRDEGVGVLQRVTVHAEIRSTLRLVGTSPASLAPYWQAAR